MGDQDHFGDAYYSALDDAYDHPDEDHMRCCAKFCNVGGIPTSSSTTCSFCGEYLDEKSKCPRCEGRGLNHLKY